MSRLAGSLQAWNAVRTQVSSQMEPLERTGCQQSQNSKAAAKEVISATGNECHQDKAAIVEFKNEASRLEGFLLLFLFGVFLWWYLEVDVFFFLPTPYISSCRSRSKLLFSFRAEGEPAAITGCRSQRLLPRARKSSCYWQLKTFSSSPPRCKFSQRVITAPSHIPPPRKWNFSGVALGFCLIHCISCWSLGVPKASLRTSPLVFSAKAVFISSSIHPVRQQVQFSLGTLIFIVLARLVLFV